MEDDEVLLATSDDEEPSHGMWQPVSACWSVAAAVTMLCGNLMLSALGFL
jgi:hypothetical protein